MKASELKKSLVGLNFTQEQVDAMVADQIAKGICEDDSNAVDLEQFANVAAEMKKALAEVGKDEVMAKAATTSAEMVVEKDDTGEESLQVWKSFESLTNAVNATGTALNSLVKSANAGDSALAKGVLALGHLTEMNFKAVSNLEKSLNEIRAAQEAINTRLGLPVAPRGVTPGLRVQPHPGEVNANGETVSAKMQKSGNDVVEALKKERNELVKNDSPANFTRLQQIASAMSEVEAGVPVDTIIARYNLSV